MYKVVGADRREYGPVTREAILEWIAQGRANAQTIAKFEDGAWKPLAAFEEFKAALGGAPALPAPGATTAVPPTYTTGDAPPFSGVGSQTGETNVASVVGIVVPIVCCCCPYVSPILGIIFSLIGLSQIRSNPSKYSTSDVLPKIGLGISIAILLLHILMSVLDSHLARYLPKMPTNF